MAKKKLPVSLFELVWYPICGLVILWGFTYVVLGLVNKYNKFDSLASFCTDFKGNFGLDIYFWGLLIIVIGVLAGIVVMLFFAKTYDRAADREQRRSARLNALKKEKEEPVVVVADQQPEVVEEPKQEERVKVVVPEEKAE